MLRLATHDHFWGFSRGLRLTGGKGGGVGFGTVEMKFEKGFFAIDLEERNNF